MKKMFVTCACAVLAGLTASATLNQQLFWITGVLTPSGYDTDTSTVTPKTAWAYDPSDSTVQAFPEAYPTSAAFTARPPAGYRVANWYSNYNLPFSTNTWTRLPAVGFSRTFPWNGENKANLILYIAPEYDYIRYNLSYETQGGDAPSPAARQGLTITNTFVVADYAGARTGYSFAHTWTNHAGVVSPAGLTIDESNAVSQFSLGNFDTNVVLCAQWNVHTYSLRYDLGEGTPESAYPTSMEYDRAFEIANPVRTGCTFKGWTVTGNDPTTARYGADASAALPVPADRPIIGSSSSTWFKNLSPDDHAAVVLSAVWETNTYVATFRISGAKNNPTTSMPVTYGAGLPSITTVPEYATGVLFDGYYTEPNGAGEKYWDFEGNPVAGRRWTVDSDQTFYECKKSFGYTIAYDANGGTGSIPDQTCVSSNVVTLSTGTGMSRNGYRLMGWAFANSAQKADFTLGQQNVSYFDLGASANVRVTLYAVWQDARRKIVFDARGGSAVAPLEKVAGEPFGDLPESNWPGNRYDFLGWYTDPDFGDPVTGETIVPAGTTEMVLYAHWKVSHYFVAYEGNGATNEVAMDVSEFAFDRLETLRANTYGKVGYAFGGWATNEERAAALKVDYPESGVVSNLVDTANATSMVYAVWMTNRYFVAYDRNGGKGEAMPVQAFWYDQTQRLAQCTYTKSMHSFVGWSNRLDGVVYPVDVAVSNLCATADGTNVLLAVWKSDLTPLSEAMHCDNLLWENASATADPKWQATYGADVGYRPSGSAAAITPADESLSVNMIASAKANGGTLSFYWKSTDEEGTLKVQYYDKIQNVSVYEVSEEWNRVEIDFPSQAGGTPRDFTFYIAYKSPNGGTVYVDQMKWVPAGSHPEPGPADAQTVTGFVPASTGFTLTIGGSSADFDYQVLSTTDLRSPDWQPLGSPVPGTGEGLIFMLTPSPADPQRFYKVETLQKEAD